jgi:antagonist of KipI
MSGLSIVRPGLFTTVQDLGRWGYQSRGVPVSGAMDQYSHRLANRLVGNSDAEATLEVTVAGPEIAFEKIGGFAVSGASFVITLNDTPVEMNRMVEASEGSVVKFGERRNGARAYFAVSGGIDVPVVLGSRSTHVLTHMGGLEGRALRGGDRLGTGRGEGVGCNFHVSAAKIAPDPFTRPLFLPAGGARLRVIPGEPGLFEHLASQRFRVSAQSNRMGYRLEGASIAAAPTGELISRAVATGAVQMPPTGQPILLMADHATTGGYAIAATVIAADLPLAGQLAPGDWIEFESCSLKEADRVLREQEARLGMA